MENQSIYDQVLKLVEVSTGATCYAVRPWEQSPLQQQPLPTYLCPSESAAPVMSGSPPGLARKPRRSLHISVMAARFPPGRAIGELLTSVDCA